MTLDVLDVDIEEMGERFCFKTIRTKGILEGVYEPRDVLLSREGNRNDDKNWGTSQHIKLSSADRMKTILITNVSPNKQYFSKNDIGCEIVVEGKLRQGSCTLREDSPRPEKYWGFKMETTNAEKISSHPETIPIVENRQNIPGYKEWRETVLSRDRKCVVCGGNKSLEAHHIYGYKEYPALRTDTENGVVVCKYCHDRYHAYYGIKDITPNKFIRYLRQFMVR